MSEHAAKVLPLLQSIESISACRNRDDLPFMLLEAVEAFFGGRTKAGILSRSRDPLDIGLPQLCAKDGCGADGLPDARWIELARAARRGEGMITSSAGGWHCGAFVLESSALYDEELVLVFGADRPLDDADISGAEALARIFGNQIRLVDYGELDSLTRLLNRKTFDEMFDHLLSVAPRTTCELWHNERRSHEKALPAWLGLIDIDRFKRINDTFGHLFGDEVLLRTGNLLRKTFRDGDRLFRFGGEEFVVILNAANRVEAEAGFERFRRAFEEHEFPQVGTVTCSIGFTAVSKDDVPIDAVGRADKAMYFAKNNGRNRVCGYETLLESGDLPAPGAETAADFDIDSLFG
ncbi:MAG: GGDEF domain-containing protein [Candidatus Accumulibacter sp.]|jgi:diguanylate cyclase (GGDEF)-like protein|nr:GGDEF domain-containing protein [Accumulibacter sp.]